MASTVGTVTQLSLSPNCEFVRRGTHGLELFRRTNGVESFTPIRPKVWLEGQSLVIGYEPCGPETILGLSVKDGVYQNPVTLEWEVWLDGEPCAWGESEKQANRSYSELAGEAY